MTDINHADLSRQLALDQFKQLLRYESETGQFYWLVSRGKKMAGSLAGSLNDDGYIKIKVGDKTYAAHRLAWLFQHGELPTGQIDHINGIRDDNRIENLRLASVKQNTWNRRMRTSNATGFRGVYLDKRYGRYAGAICVNGKRMHLGCFGSPEDAAKAVAEAHVKHYGEFASQEAVARAVIAVGVKHA